MFGFITFDNTMEIEHGQIQDSYFFQTIIPSTEIELANNFFLHPHKPELMPVCLASVSSRGCASVLRFQDSTNFPMVYPASSKKVNYGKPN